VLAAVLIPLQSLGDDIAREFSSGAAGRVRIGLGVVVIAAAAFVYSWLAWRVRAYRITEQQIELRTGVVFRSHRHLPLDRIESVDTAQPIIPRLLGLAEIRVEAVSQGDSELKLRYLSEPAAVLLRDELTARRTRRARRAPETVEATEPIVRVEPRELAIAYLLLPAALAVPIMLVPLAALVVTGESIVAVLVVLPSAAVGAFPLLVGVERLWDFRLEDAGDTLVVRRGLLNLTTQRIVTGRIQAVRIDQPLLWRPWKRFRVVVDVAGYRGQRDQEGAAAATLLPVATAEVVRTMLTRIEIRTDLDTLEFKSAPGRAKWRSPLRWRFYQVAWTDSHAVCRSGRFWRRTAVVPHAKLQSVRLTQGPWQRRLMLCTLHLDTAGARIKARAEHRDVVDAVRLAKQSRGT
jgi:putative membrane protein